MALTKEEFGQQIKTKYPQYQDMDNEELADRIVAKYPVYRSQIKEKSALRKVGDFFTSSTQAFGETLGEAGATQSQDFKEAASSQLALDDANVELGKAIIKNKEEGKDTSRLERQYEANTGRVFKPEEVAPAIEKSAKQIAGEGLGTGLEIASFGTFGAASKVPTLAKPLLSKTVGEGIKTGAKIGGAFGTGFGVSEALQDDKSFGQVAKEGLIGGTIGAAGGAVLGGATGALTQGVGALTSRAQKLTPVIRKKVGQAAANKLDQVSRDILKMSPTASKNEAKWNKNTPKFLVDEGIITLIESDGKKLSTGEAIAAMKEKYAAEAEAFNTVLKDSGEYLSLKNLEKQALDDIVDLKTRGSDYGKAKKQIADEIASFRENFQDTALVDGDDLLINVEDFNRIKSGLWSRTSSFSATQADKLSSDVNYRMGQVAKGMIENKIEDTSIKAMNSRLGDFVSAMKVLENAEGKAVPGGFFGRQFTRLAGTIAGSTGGLPGSVVGNITGGVLADLMINPKIKTSVLTKFVNKLNKTAEGRTIAEEAAAILKKRGEDRSSRLLLKAPEDIPLGTGAKKDTSKLLSQEEAQQVLDALKIPEDVLLLPEKASPSVINLPGEADTTLEARGALRTK